MGMDTGSRTPTAACRAIRTTATTTDRASTTTTTAIGTSMGTVMSMNMGMGMGMGMITATTTTIATARRTASDACPAIRITAMTMADAASGPAALLRLMAWLSPAFPVGSFSYSHGLERAAHDGLLRDAAGLEDWLGQLLAFGSARSDAILFAEAWRRARAGADLVELADLGEALAGAEERHRETVLQGAAFARALAASGWHRVDLPANCSYCIAVGAAAGVAGVALDQALAAYLQAFVSNLLQAGIRFGLTGQDGAVAALARLEPAVLETAGAAARSTLDDLGSAAILSEIAAMRHETQYSRLFRS